MEIDLLLSRELNTIDSYINKSSDVRESYILEKYKSDLKSLIIEYRNKMYYNGSKSTDLITYDLVSDPGFNSTMNVLNYAEYISENLDRNIPYTEYLAENYKINK